MDEMILGSRRSCPVSLGLSRVWEEFDEVGAFGVGKERREFGRIPNQRVAEVPEIGEWLEGESVLVFDESTGLKRQAFEACHSGKDFSTAVVYHNDESTGARELRQYPRG